MLLAVLIVSVTLLLLCLERPCVALEVSHSKKAEDPMVVQLRQAIEMDTFQGPQLGLLHLQLAMTLQQQWFNKQRDGNGLAEALDAYNEAFQLMKQGGEIRKTVEVAFHRGVLLKVMGRGNESIASYREALKYELSNIDIAAIHYNRADSELMMGQVDLAVNSYQMAIKLVPCKTERYYGYVMALKEQGQYSTQDWQKLVEELLRVEADCGQLVEFKHQQDRESDEREELLKQSKTKQNKKSKNKKTKSTVPTVEVSSTNSTALDALWVENYLPSYLFSDLYFGLDYSSGVFPVKKSDLLYAIYIAADKAKDYAVAWRYLVQANNAEKQHRGVQFDKQQAIFMKNTTVQIFNEALVDTFPNIATKASRVPIFVIGMMR
jgi:tetratricopeptide (TPR) repeat protein